MKIEASNSFFESVEKLVWYDTNLWKVWSAIRYDIPLFLKMYGDSERSYTIINGGIIVSLWKCYIAL